MTQAPALLLLDLDGVSALERAPPGGEVLEIFRLHEDLNAGIAALGCPVAVVTHRSRKEALRILAAIGVRREGVTGLFSAEDFLFASLARPFDLFRRGLLKSAALPAIERKFGLARQRMAIIDDREANLLDLQSAGLGLCMKAPSQSSEQPDDLVSFDFAEAVRIFTDWRREGGVRGTIQPLTPQRVFAAPDWRTGKNTRLSRLTVFSSIRRVARYARDLWRTAS